MRKQKYNILFKLIALILINAFFCMDISWAAGGNIRGLTTHLAPRLNISDLNSVFEKVTPGAIQFDKDIAVFRYQVGEIYENNRSVEEITALIEQHKESFISALYVEKEIEGNSWRKKELRSMNYTELCTLIPSDDSYAEPVIYAQHKIKAVLGGRRVSAPISMAGSWIEDLKCVMDIEERYRNETVMREQMTPSQQKIHELWKLYRDLGVGMVMPVDDNNTVYLYNREDVGSLLYSNEELRFALDGLISPASTEALFKSDVLQLVALEPMIWGFPNPITALFPEILQICLEHMRSAADLDRIIENRHKEDLIFPRIKLNFLLCDVGGLTAAARELYIDPHIVVTVETRQRQARAASIVAQIPSQIKAEQIPKSTRQAFVEHMQRIVQIATGVTNAEIDNRLLISLMNRIAINENYPLLGVNIFRFRVRDKRGEREYAKDIFHFEVDVAKQNVFIMDSEGNRRQFALSSGFDVRTITTILDLEIKTKQGSRNLFEYLFERKWLPEDVTREMIISQDMTPEIHFYFVLDERHRLQYTTAEIGRKTIELVFMDEGIRWWKGIGNTEEQSYVSDYGGKDFRVSIASGQIVTIGHLHPLLHGSVQRKQKVLVHAGDAAAYLHLGNQVRERCPNTKISNIIVDTVEHGKEWMVRIFIPRLSVNWNEYNALIKQAKSSDKQLRRGSEQRINEITQHIQENIDDYFEVVEIPIILEDEGDRKMPNPPPVVATPISPKPSSVSLSGLTYDEHERDIDRRIAKEIEKYYSKPLPWAPKSLKRVIAVFIPQSFTKPYTLEDSQAKLVMEFLENVGLVSLKDLFKTEVRSGRVWQIDSRPKKVYANGHAGPRGIYVFNPDTIFGGPKDIVRWEAGVLIHEIIAKAGCSHNQALAMQKVFDWYYRDKGGWISGDVWQHRINTKVAGLLTDLSALSEWPELPQGKGAEISRDLAEQSGLKAPPGTTTSQEKIVLLIRLINDGLEYPTGRAVEKWIESICKKIAEFDGTLPDKTKKNIKSVFLNKLVEIMLEDHGEIYFIIQPVIEVFEKTGISIADKDIVRKITELAEARQDNPAVLPQTIYAPTDFLSVFGEHFNGLNLENTELQTIELAIRIFYRYSYWLDVMVKQGLSYQHAARALIYYLQIQERLNKISISVQGNSQDENPDTHPSLRWKPDAFIQLIRVAVLDPDNDIELKSLAKQLYSDDQFDSWEDIYNRIPEPNPNGQDEIGTSSEVKKSGALKHIGTHPAKEVSEGVMGIWREAAANKLVETKTIQDKKIEAIFIFDAVYMPEDRAGHHFYDREGNLVIVTRAKIESETLEGIIAGETAYHDSDEAGWRTWLSLYGSLYENLTEEEIKRRSHILASARQVFAFSENGELTPYHKQQLTKMPLDRLIQLMLEDRADQHNIIRRYLNEADFAKIVMYETRFRQIVKEKIRLLIMNELPGDAKVILSSQGQQAISFTFTEPVLICIGGTVLILHEKDGVLTLEVSKDIWERKEMLLREAYYDVGNDELRPEAMNNFNIPDSRVSGIHFTIQRRRESITIARHPLGGDTVVYFTKALPTGSADARTDVAEMPDTGFLAVKRMEYILEVERAI
ncbi:MAG: hypothetical protein ABH952_02840 [Candidatus Omnitrophota bacterium]